MEINTEQEPKQPRAPLNGYRLKAVSRAPPRRPRALQPTAGSLGTATCLPKATLFPFVRPHRPCVRLATFSLCFLVSTASEVSQEHLLTQTGAKLASTESRPWLCASKAPCACCRWAIALHKAALAWPRASLLRTGASSSKVPSGWQCLALLCLLPSPARTLSPARDFPKVLRKGSNS